MRIRLDIIKIIESGKVSWIRLVIPGLVGRLERQIPQRRRSGI